MGSLTKIAGIGGTPVQSPFIRGRLKEVWGELIVGEERRW